MKIALIVFSFILLALWFLWKRGQFLTEKEVLGVLNFRVWRNTDELVDMLARERGFLGDPRKNLRASLEPILQKFVDDCWVQSRDGLLIYDDQKQTSCPEKEFRLTVRGAKIREKWLRPLA